MPRRSEVRAMEQHLHVPVNNSLHSLCDAPVVKSAKSTPVVKKTLCPEEKKKTDKQMR